MSFHQSSFYTAKGLSDSSASLHLSVTMVHKNLLLQLLSSSLLLFYSSQLRFSFGFTNDTDRQALLAIKDQILEDPFMVLSSWNNSLHFCDWQGVKCSRRHQRATVLNLSSLQFDSLECLNGLSLLNLDQYYLELHWSLVIICIPDKKDESGPIILHLDSRGLHFSKSIFDNIKSFLRKEWKYQNQGEASPDLPIADRIWKNLPRRIEEKTIMVPQQRNDYDSGLFVLFFMERFLDKAPQRLKRQDLAMFGKKWFKPEEASNLRRKICKLLVEEFQTATKDNSVSDHEPLSSAGKD